MSKAYRTTNLTGLLAIGKPEEKEPLWCEVGHFDKNSNFISNSWPYENIFFPWEWISIPELVELALKSGVEIPDGTVDISRTF